MKRAKTKGRSWLSLWGVALFFLVLTGAVPARGSYQPQTAVNPAVAANELTWQVKPLQKDELIAEADAWVKLVQNKTRQISDAEIALIKQRQQIDEAKKAENALKSEKNLMGSNLQRKQKKPKN
jgi:hypothetical protein